MSDSVRVECDHCGNDLFVLLYDANRHEYRAECDSCGMAVNGLT